MSKLTDLTKKLWKEYLLGDKKSVLSLTELFEDNSIVIGTGVHEFYRNLHEFKISLLSELQERKNIIFQIKDLECEELKVSGNVSLVYGKVKIRWANEEETLKINMDSRFSIVYKKINGCWKILHIHQSTPNPEQLSGESYPKTLVGQIETAHEIIESLTQLAETDSLTGLINIRTFKEKYNNRNQKDCWLFAIDVDNFKEINDNHGHLQGDSALVDLSRILTSTVRENDLVCRMGGDEFVLLCSGIKTEKDVLNLTNRLFTKVKIASKFNSKLSSISIGFTKVTNGESFEKAFERADYALYVSKRNGKGKASAKY